MMSTCCDFGYLQPIPASHALEAQRAKPNDDEKSQCPLERPHVHDKVFRFVYDLEYEIAHGQQSQWWKMG